MNLYEKAMIQVKNNLEEVKEYLSNIYNYDVINKIDCRIKSPDSIIDKMKKKQYSLNYKSLIENINDIAGIRVVCPFKNDIYKIVEIVQEDTNLEIINEKDYIKNPKKSGYSGYHIIAKTPVNVGDAYANVKTEIQIRSMAMDFWSSTEHKIKYKSTKELSNSDAKKLVKYGKMVNNIDDKISKIYAKYYK